MKKLIALLMALCLAVGMTAAFAEEDEDMVSYVKENPAAAPFVSAWVAEDGEWSVEVFDEDGGLKLMIVHKLGDNKEDVWEYSADLTENKLTTVPLGLHYKQDTVSGDWDVTYYEDGDAEFEIAEDGKLVWKDLKEDAGKGLLFQKIGSFYNGRWMKDDIEVVFFDWYEGQYDIRLYKRGENNEILDDAILKGDYDPETNTVTAEGAFNDGESFTAVFGYDENGSIVWIENGVSTVLELSVLSD
ncbi:MAG: hypothetical protein IJK28_06350 [Clostridia bacterium]|nr:hypothetical protein [Clostridia bacterium]